MNQFMQRLGDWCWSAPMLIAVMGISIILSFRSRFVQVKYFKESLYFMLQEESGGKGDVSAFAALCTSLSATLGTGNIVGVATAITLGGPGALFWMVVSAFFAMATKYAEGLLAIRYRVFDRYGAASGGPFYYIEKGLGRRFRWLAKTFAVAGAVGGVCGVGTLIQSGGIAQALAGYFDPNQRQNISLFGNRCSVWVMGTAVVVAVLVGIIIMGGIGRISSAAQILVPSMTILYVGSLTLLLVLHIHKLPQALWLVVRGAFSPQAVTGGAVGSMFRAAQVGISRSFLSHEAGMGSAPIAAAAARTNDAVRQGLVTMTGTFIDTIVMCTMTGLSLIVTGVWKQDLVGVQMTSAALVEGLPFSATVCRAIITLSLSLFAFTTIIGWNYYGEKCIEYLCGGRRRAVPLYRLAYVLAVFLGPFLSVHTAFSIADICNALMALPNMTALLLLSGEVATCTRDYNNLRRD